jgi:hypothetical protein
LHVELTQGQRHEMVAAERLLDEAHGDVFIADTAYDADPISTEG